MRNFTTMMPKALARPNWHTWLSLCVSLQVKDDGSKVRVLVKTGEEVPDKSFKREAPASSSDAGSSDASSSETPGSA